MTATQKAERYAQIKLQIKDLEAELKALQPEVETIEELATKEGYVTQYGTFKMTYVPKWKYSDELELKIKMTNDRLKLAKKEEEQTGKAQKISDGGRLVFTANK